MRTLSDGRPASRPPPSLDELRRRRDEISAIALRRGATRIRVFGSVARGDEDPDSDLDLLVEFERGRGLFDWSALIGDLEALLGCAEEVTTERGLRDRVRPRVLADAVPL